MPVCYIYIIPECVSARTSLGMLVYIAKKFFSTFRGGEVEPVTPLKYGPVYEPVRLSVPSFARRTPLRRVCC